MSALDHWTALERKVMDEARAGEDRWMNNQKTWSPPPQSSRAISGTASEPRSTRALELAAAGLAGALVFAIGLRLVERR